MKNGLIYELRKGLYEFSNGIKYNTANWNFKVLIRIPRWRYFELQEDFVTLAYHSSKFVSLHNLAYDGEIDGNPYVFDKNIQYIEYQKILPC